MKPKFRIMHGGSGGWLGVLILYLGSETYDGMELDVPPISGGTFVDTRSRWDMYATASGRQVRGPFGL